MSCLECVRLRHHYEAALRHWERVLSSSQNHELIGVIARQAGQLRYQAQSERDALAGGWPSTGSAARYVDDNCD